MFLNPSFIVRLCEALNESRRKKKKMHPKFFRLLPPLCSSCIVNSKKQIGCHLKSGSTSVCIKDGFKYGMWETKSAIFFGRVWTG